ncbi:hypothetical protein [Actinomadura terrae]|uniref:hypothetical protein n=1 Tax=Actinomadura terrae TaxID=604353 RepID=UPI001FA6D8D5|nr:hypothetical protein [Actinomadura terrae]
MTATRTRPPARRPNPVVAAFVKLHGRPVEGAQRWAVLAAYATTLVVLPSCLWRLAFGAFDLPIVEHREVSGDMDDDLPGWLPGWVYMVLLSAVSEALAFLAVGLVNRWGEVVPKWVPFWGGRRIPPLAAVIPAGLGASLLIANSFFALFFAESNENFDKTFAHEWQLNLLRVCYAPLLAWGPLLAVLTVAYYVRRRRTG